MSQTKTLTHYVYSVTDTNGKAYIGSRSCIGHPEDDIQYQGSSEDVKAAIETGMKFQKRILSVHPTVEEARAEEKATMIRLGAVDSPLFYNKRLIAAVGNAGKTHIQGSLIGTSLTDPTDIVEISSSRGAEALGFRFDMCYQAAIGNKRSMYGRTWVSNGYTPIDSPHKCAPLSQETKDKVSNALTGRKLSEETKARMSRTRGEKALMKAAKSGRNNPLYNWKLGEFTTRKSMAQAGLDPWAYISKMLPDDDFSDLVDNFKEQVYAVR